MSLRVYNTLTNKKEPFEPVRPPKVGIYLCGPTVYKPSHIGHAVGPIIFDAVKRYLTFRGFEVTWVVNITDVEDKIIVEAAEQGCTAPELAERIGREYLDSMDKLNVTGIDKMPKASEFIEDIIRFVERLIANGAAYVSGGDVYFDVTSDDDYGKLSNRSIEDQTGQRDLASGEKRHPADFALWKEAKPEEPDEVKFDSPWGRGRPGWHIECSVMSTQMLGDTFDIHGGGLDLVFPHHENEIAQSESATGKLFAKYWLHHGLTRFNTKKVSKSDPEMQAALAAMTLSRLLDEYDGELLRYFVLSTHYRRPIEYSTDEIASKRKGLQSFYRLFDRIERIAGQSVYATTPEPLEPQASACADVGTGEGRRGPKLAALKDANPDFAKTVDDHCSSFIEVMDDDFNTAGGIAVLFELANAINRFIEQHKVESSEGQALKAVVVAAGRELVELGRLLGLFISPPEAEAKPGGEVLDKVLAVAVQVRQAAKSKKDFATADAVRDGLAKAGVTLEDRPGETIWRIEGDGDTVEQVMSLLIDVRKSAKGNKDSETADLVRDRLTAAGVTLEDRPGGTEWREAKS